jgi:hypothetical protein
MEIFLSILLLISFTMWISSGIYWIKSILKKSLGKKITPKYKPLHAFLLSVLSFMLCVVFANLISPSPSEPPTKIVYEFVNSKVENFGHRNRMDLYVYGGQLNIPDLKTFCVNQKQKITSGMFYYIVIFDSKEYAVFPKNPFTAEFGMDETASKHIRAIYVYNRANGFSELRHYEKNSWESLAKYEKI